MQNNFEIRIARPEDEAPLSDLLKASYSVLMTAHYDQAILGAVLPVMARANPALLSAGTFYVAETTDGSVAGCGGWSRERPGTSDVTPERSGCIDRFYVHLLTSHFRRA